MMGEDAGGITAQDLISPMETLAVLLLAFVLVVAAESYATAQAAAGTEAGAVDYLFEVADLSEDFVAEYGQVPLPCDAQGRPTS